MDQLHESTMISHQKIEAAWHRTVVMIAVWVEILVGISFLLVPNVQSQFIYGTTPVGIGDPWARFAGIALISLGIACHPSRFAGTHRSAVRALFIFNTAVTIFFAWVGVATTFQGVLLCPVVMLHAILAIALAFALRHENS